MAHTTAPLPRSAPFAFAIAAVVLGAVAVAPAAQAADAPRGIAAIGASAITNISAGAPETASAAAARRRIDYRSLKALGVSAKNASLTGKIVRVRLKNKRCVEIRLAVIRDRQLKLQARDAVMLKRGSRTSCAGSTRPRPGGSSTCASRRGSAACGRAGSSR